MYRSWIKKISIYESISHFEEIKENNQPDLVTTTKKLNSM